MEERPGQVENTFSLSEETQGWMRRVSQHAEGRKLWRDCAERKTPCGPQERGGYSQAWSIFHFWPRSASVHIIKINPVLSGDSSSATQWVLLSRCFCASSSLKRMLEIPHLLMSAPWPFPTLRTLNWCEDKCYSIASMGFSFSWSTIEK